MMTSHENQEYDFRLEEYVSRAVDQNSLIPYGEQNSLTNDLNFRLDLGWSGPALETAANFVYNGPVFSWAAIIWSPDFSPILGGHLY